MLAPALLRLYLAFNCVQYAVLAVWCGLAPATTARFVGLVPANAGGESEYLAVYGGLQAGLAAFYGLSWKKAQHQRSALLMSLVMYGGIVLARGTAVVRLGFGELGNARIFFGLEILLFCAALLLAIVLPRATPARP